MRNELIVNLLKIELECCKKNLEKAEKKIKNLPAGRLRESTINNYPRFYYCTIDSKGKYIKADNKKLISALATKEYYSMLAKECKSRIKSISKVISQYESFDWDKLENKINQNKMQYVDVDIVSEKSMVKSWLQKPYRKLKHFENKYPTKKGDMVKSKTEVIIADILFDYGIPYKYEMELVLSDGKRCYPDFTIFDVKQNRIIIFEHFGLMNDVEYAKKTRAKINAYIKNGFVPFDTFIYTFESENIDFQIETVRSYVQNVLAA